MTEVPKAALDWLFGDGPDPDGKWFGECEDAVRPLAGKYPRKYWWRSKFRVMIENAALVAQPQSLTGCQLHGPGECQKAGKCLSVACNHYGKTEFRPRMTVLAHVDGILYPPKEN